MLYSPLQWPQKDPGEILDYRLDWTARLTQNGTTDTISTSTWAIQPAVMTMTITQQSLSGNVTVVWLSGGNLGQTYVVTNTILTTGGRTMVQSGTLMVNAK